MSTGTAPGTAPLPELVVRALARVALAGLGIGGVLIVLAIVQPGRVDAAIIAAIGVLLNIAAASAGALGAILASTRSGESQPVTVTNAEADPVPTSDVPPTPPARTGRRHRPDPTE